MNFPQHLCPKHPFFVLFFQLQLIENTCRVIPIFVSCVFLRLVLRRSRRKSQSRSWRNRANLEPTANFLERVWKVDDALYTADVQTGRMYASKAEFAIIRWRLLRLDAQCEKCAHVLMPYISRQANIPTHTFWGFGSLAVWITWGQLARSHRFLGVVWNGAGGLCPPWTKWLSTCCLFQRSTLHINREKDQKKSQCSFQSVT